MDNQGETFQMPKIDPYYKEPNSNLLSK